MRAAVLAGGGSFDVAEVDDPVPGPGDLVLRVDACGICGSDLKIFQHFPAGTILGHEFSGQITAVGAGVSGWSEGQHVTALPLEACWQCAWCLGDHPAHCDHAAPMGLTGSPGGFAELVRVQAAATLPLPPGTEKAGPLVEPLAVGLHCVNVAGVAAGDRVLIIGGGNVGSSIALWCRRMGAIELVVSDPAPTRRAAAQAAGATAVHDPADGPPPGGFDVVFECVGAPGLIQTAIDAVRPRGRVLVGGVCIVPDQLSPVVAVMKEAEVRFAVYYGRREFAAAAALLSSPDFDMAAFVSSTVALDGVGDAFQRLVTTSTERKILVAPNR